MVMGAFAVGTWPALLGAAALGRAFARLATTAPLWLRGLVAAALLLLAAAPLSFMADGAHHHGALPASPANPTPATHEHHHPAPP